MNFNEQDAVFLMSALAICFWLIFSFFVIMIILRWASELRTAKRARDETDKIFAEYHRQDKVHKLMPLDEARIIRNRVITELAVAKAKNSELAKSVKLKPKGGDDHGLI